MMLRSDESMIKDPVTWKNGFSRLTKISRRPDGPKLQPVINWTDAGRERYPRQSQPEKTQSSSVFRHEPWSNVTVSIGENGGSPFRSTKQTSPIHSTDGGMQIDFSD
jgi:hypothetical protein